jgi:hypothetical protein
VTPLDAPESRRAGLADSSKKQHYISQAELRLNASNPFAEQKNQRIYSFKIKDRDPPIIELEDHRGMRIANALSQEDLFSYDVFNKEWRLNLEAAFQRHETRIGALSRELLKIAETDDLSRLAKPLKSLFIAKFINFLRNPYSVRKVLNTVGVAATYSPTDPGLQRLFASVINGRKPHRHAICSRFGIEEKLYDRWLAALFMLLEVEVRDGKTVLEKALSQLFSTSYAVARLYKYNTQDEGIACLVSDRGYNSTRNEEHLFEIEFNISAKMFVRFGFADLSGFVPTGNLLFSAAARSIGNSDLQVELFKDDLEELLLYNRLTVYQAAKRAYSSSSTPYL